MLWWMLACADPDPGLQGNRGPGSQWTPSAPVDTAPPPLQVVLGTDADGFALLGQEVPLAIVFGPAGGWSSDVVVEVEGVSTDSDYGHGAVGVELDLLDIRGDSLVFANQRMNVELDPEGRAWGLRIFFDRGQDDICELKGARADLTATVTDYLDETRVGEAQVLATLTVVNPYDEDWSCP